METTHETDWRQEIRDAIRHLSNAQIAVEKITGSMLPTPDTIAEYAQMQKVKHALHNTKDTLHYLDMYLS